MIVKFNYTQAEIVDAAMRILDRSKTVRRGRWQGLVLGAAMCWLIGFAGFFWRPVYGAVFGLLMAVGAAILYPTLRRSSTERQLTRLVREKHGHTNSFVCEVQLTPAGFRTSYPNTQMSYEWSKVEEIRVTTNSVDIFTSGGGVIVRNNAFETPEARRQFIDLANTYLAKARENEHSAR